MERPRSRRRWIWTALLIIVLLALLAVLGFYLLGPTIGTTLLTTEMKITITPAQITGQFGLLSFLVPANTNLTLQSNDNLNHTCIIAGSGQTVPVQLNGGNVSAPFR